MNNSLQEICFHCGINSMSEVFFVSSVRILILILFRVRILVGCFVALKRCDVVSIFEIVLIFCIFV
jgi:hypothetical protein